MTELLEDSRERLMSFEAPAVSRAESGRVGTLSQVGNLPNLAKVRGDLR